VPLFTAFQQNIGGLAMIKLTGIPASAGIGIGKALALRDTTLDHSGVKYSGEASEKSRLLAAIAEFETTTTKRAERLTRLATQKEADIILGQISMLNDPFMLAQFDECITGGRTAESAVAEICQLYVEMFEGVEDEMMRQRAADVRDVRTRMLKILLGVQDIDIETVEHGTVLAAHDIMPSVTAAIHANRIVAIITEVGGETSHNGKRKIKHHLY
jgi:phosphotransferase system enzyme I (PtsI)